MDAIILAAGRGSRMRSLTDDQPKCMTMLSGRPLLEWQERALNNAGADQIHVVTGYLDHVIKSGRSTVHNSRWSKTNMVSSLACASVLLKQRPHIISYSDIVYRKEIPTTLAQASGDIVITYDRLWADLWQLRFDDPLSDAETFRDRDNVLLEIGSRASSMEEIRGQYMGLLKITPQGWAAIETLLHELGQDGMDKLDMTTLLRKLLEADVTINTVGIDGGWCEVDSENDLTNYETRLNQPTPWAHDWRA